MTRQQQKQLIKTYLLVLLAECEEREKKRGGTEPKGQTLEGIASDLERDVAGWPEEDKKAMREDLIWKMHPVKSGVIQ
jgi:hypothetical protein